MIEWITKLFSSSPRGTRALGAWGERVAARYLRKSGLRIVARNVRTPIGEADLIAHDRRADVMVLVEVKTRLHAAGRRPESNITAAKARKLAQLVGVLGRRDGWPTNGWRIDVVAVDRREDGSRDVRWYRAAVGEHGRIS